MRACVTGLQFGIRGRPYTTSTIGRGQKFVKIANKLTPLDMGEGVSKIWKKCRRRLWMVPKYLDTEISETFS